MRQGSLATLRAMLLGAGLALGGPALADPYAVIDNEGFGAALTAFTLELPPGWHAESRVAWTKPCSANELYEVILTASSPDGQSYLRMMPGHSVQWFETTVDASVDPAIAQMALAQAEANRNQLQTTYRNSNCHLGRVNGGTRQIIDTLILPNRPAGARVVQIRPNEQTLALYKAGFGAQQPGLVVTYDSVIADLGYTGPAGAMVERLWLTWYQFADDPQANYMAGVPSLHYQATTIDTITFAAAPAARAADLDTAAGILASVKAETQWTAKVREVQDKINAERQRAAKERSDAQDKRNKDFIDMIRQ